VTRTVDAQDLLELFLTKLADLSPDKDRDSYVIELREMVWRLRRGETAYNVVRPQSDWGAMVASQIDNLLSMAAVLPPRCAHPDPVFATFHSLIAEYVRDSKSGEVPSKELQLLMYETPLRQYREILGTLKTAGLVSIDDQGVVRWLGRSLGEGNERS
jgi:hypothetical protein